MKRPLALVGTLAITAGIVAGSIIAPTVVGASSHREAPAISKDPSADNTDVYAFLSKDAPNTVTLVANYIPAEEPSGGPNFYEWDPSVLYEIHVHNRGGVNDEITYQFRFQTNTIDPSTFLYNTGQITFDDGRYTNWNRPQTYTVTRIDEAGSARQLTHDALVPPVNIGPRSTPNYESLVTPAITHLNNGGTVFAGQRDDPFFVDLGSIFDLLGLRPFNMVHKIPLPNSNGVDDVGGLSVHSIVLQVPISDLTADHDVPIDPNNPDAVIGVYASASRQQFSVLDERSGEKPSGNFVQISRLGEPLINEVLIPLSKKDYWNRTDPADDRQFVNFYLNPEPALRINQLYHEPPVKPIEQSGRTDLVAVLLTGLKLPAGNPTGVTNFTYTGSQPMDLVRLNVAVPPTVDVGAGNSLGVLAGDLRGFPNGRRLEDDVTDIEIRAIAQGYGSVVTTTVGLLPADRFDKSPNNSIGDGDNQNDKPFMKTFPYLATPKSGYDPLNHVQDSTPIPLN